MTLGPCGDVAGAGGGSVERWPRNARPPRTSSTSAVATPAHGVTPVASAVAVTGPRTNVSS